MSTTAAPLNASTDLDPMVATLQGPDRPAQREAVERLQAYLRKSLARGFGHQIEAAELDDITQEVLLKVVSKVDGFSGRSKFTTWAMSIAVNHTLSVLRKRKYQHVSLEDAQRNTEFHAATPGARNVVQDAQRHSILNALFDEVLSERQRMALRSELGGLPPFEVAEHMGMTPGALYKMLHDARKKLRAALDARGLTLDELLPERGPL